MRSRLRTAAAPFAALLALTLLSGCTDDWSRPHPAPSAVGAPRAGFMPSSTPSPEATVMPDPGSWDGVRPSAGYRVVLVHKSDTPPTRALVAAVRSWAKSEDVSFRELTVGDEPIDAIVAAMKLHPDLIVTAGNDLIDPLATVTASHLDQKFLIVGAEVAEPTENVTAVDWSGASFRGEGLGMSSDYDAKSFTPARCSAAIRAGVAAVLTGLTGVVLWLD